MKVVKLIIIGSGALAEEVHWLAQEVHPSCSMTIRVVGFYDDSQHGLKELCKMPVISNINGLLEVAGGASHFVCAIGDNATRRRVTQQIESATQLEPFSIIHSTVIMGHSVNIGQGSVVEPYVVIGPNATIGGHSIINTGSSIGHDCAMGAFVNICPGVRVGGFAKIGDEALLGSNSVIYPGVCVGKSATVGAGSFVIRSVGEGKSVFGNPAKLLN